MGNALPSHGCASHRIWTSNATVMASYRKSRKLRNIAMIVASEYRKHFIDFNESNTTNWLIYEMTFLTENW
jgi:hypothetical protein